MRNEYFKTVKSYLNDLEIDITTEDASEQLVVVNDGNRGLNNMVLDCEDELLIIEQFIMPMENGDKEFLTRLLQMNRSLVHGCFALDESGNRLIFRDTLQLANLDLNELESSINSLGLALAEFGNEFIEVAKSGGMQ